jgi:hypothetical protein
MTMMPTQIPVLKYITCFYLGMLPEHVAKTMAETLLLWQPGISGIMFLCVSTVSITGMSGTMLRSFTYGLLGFMVFSATLNLISAISWRSVWLVEEIGVPNENQRPAASHWQTLSHNVVSSTPCHERDSTSHI